MLLQKKQMNKVFTVNGWLDYLYWQQEDKKTLRRINSLIRDIEKNGNKGMGKPEPLLGDMKGFYSRRINDRNRLIYSVDSENICILACRYHYDDH